MSTQLTQEQMQVLGMGVMTPIQRENFLERLGKMVFDSALIKLLETLNEDQVHALNHALEAQESYQGIFEYLQVTYPQFMSYMENVQERFVSEFMSEMKVA